jgi:hypothetical protein
MISLKYYFVFSVVLVKKNYVIVVVACHIDHRPRCSCQSASSQLYVFLGVLRKIVPVFILGTPDCNYKGI